jgi:hypothetical protein|tara:strand:+ start:365 stop:541 length:177 start_codon:yes stop_codon:yes gene_type:complete
MSRRNSIEKSWVIVRFNNNSIKVWRDYGEVWGSALYEVLDYFDGSFIDAKKHSKTMEV